MTATESSRSAVGAPAGIELRPVTDEEWPDFVRAGEIPFHNEPRPADFELFRIGFPLELTVAAFEAGRIVATSGAFDFQLGVPGGADVRTAGVTAVGTLPTHRRRGLLTAIMRRQLTDYHEAGIPLAALWASESAIYGRFGYGLASWCLRVEVPRGSAFVPGVVPAGGRLRLADPQSTQSWELLAAVDARSRAGRPGRYARDAAWMRRTAADPEHWRDGSGPLQLVLHEGDDGVDGFALYSVTTKWEQSLPAGQASVRELQATSGAVHATLWRYLLDIDLVATVVARALPLDEPLLAMLADPRGARPCLRDNLFVRLVDVPVALAARTYSRPLDTVIAVRDPLCPWNEDRFRLCGDATGARCSPTSDAPELTVSSTTLGAAYLGGPTLRTLAAAGQVQEDRPGALAAVSAAFHGEVAPYCSEVF
ncbi:MAG: GNAT family N-acetyltransferase [Frankiaceae bacterium]